jgi:hypothetical protein
VSEQDLGKPTRASAAGQGSRPTRLSDIANECARHAKLRVCLFAAILCAHASAQINLSHDLIPLRIASQNLTPDNPNLDARPLFQAALDYAKKNKIHLITADQGAYYFLTPAAKDRYLSINTASDVTIDLHGSNIYVKQSYLMWLVAVDCNRITLTNFTLDSQQLPFTQVRLTSVAANQRTLNYVTQPGWPSPAIFNTMTNPDGSSQDLWALVFRNGALVSNSNRLPLTRPLQEGVLQVQKNDAPWTQPNVLATYQPGDTIVVTARGGEAPLLITGGDGNVIRDVDVYSSGAIGVHLDSVSNATVDHVRVMPRPGTDRLIGANADGIHLSYALANNIVANCYVSRSIDDAIAINSPFLAFVSQQTGARQLRLLRNFNSIFPNGLAVSFVSTLTAGMLPGGHILSQEPPYTDPPTQNSTNIALDQDLPSLQKGFGMIYADPQNRGAGSMIQDNLIEDVFSARGIYLGGVSGVTIQRNIIRRTNGGAIVAHEDVAAYPMGPNRDLQIVNNVVEHAIGPAAVGTGSLAALASIFVLSTDQNFGFVAGAPNTNIAIANNYIVNSGRGGIWISNLNGGTVEGNTILQYNTHPELAAWGLSADAIAQLRQDFTQAVVVKSSQGVTVQNNVAQKRPHLLAQYYKGPN